MIVGFTGTQGLLTNYQYDTLGAKFEDLLVEEFHHGGCIGADYSAHHLFLQIHPTAIIHVHWCDIKDKQAKLKGFFVPYDELPPLERNHVIVNTIDVLFAAPMQEKEVLRSGTWATIRYAKKKKVPVIMLSRKVP